MIRPLMMAAALSVAACSPAPAQELVDPAPHPRGLLADLNDGLPLGGPAGREFQRLFLSAPNACGVPDENDNGPFDQTCSWRQQGNLESQADVYVGLKNDRVVSVMTRDPGVPGWTCQAPERLSGYSICNAPGIAAWGAEATTFWNIFANVWVLNIVE